MKSKRTDKRTNTSSNKRSGDNNCVMIFKVILLPCVDNTTVITVVIVEIKQEIQQMKITKYETCKDKSLCVK